jgi:hypothetical protein
VASSRTAGNPARRFAARLRSAASIVLALSAVAIRGTVAFAASPSPTGGVGGDPRSSGQGPGLVGDPLAAIVLVAAIALASVIVTLAYVRLTGGTRESRRGG